MVVQLNSTLTCPECGFVTTESMTLIETAVPINVRKRDFDLTDGMRVGRRSYTSHALLSAAKRNRSFEQVRLDPEDPSRIYVQFKDGWVTADSHDADDLRSLSPLELLVEGMHTEMRWDDNTQVRQAEQLKVNRKIDELEAAARARRKPSADVPQESTAPPAPVEDLFAKFALNPQRFETHENV